MMHAPHMINHLSSIKPNIKQIAEEIVHINKTIHHIVSTKQSNSETQIGLQIIQEVKKNIREENLRPRPTCMLYYPILCYYTDVDFFSFEQARICRTVNVLQTHACSLFTVIAMEFFHLSKFY